MNTRMFITVCNGVITSRQETSLKKSALFGTPWYMHEQVDVPHEAQITPGDKIEYYGPGWKRKPDLQLIEEGIILMPEGYVREGGELREMQEDERIIAGLEDPKPGLKVLDGKIVPMPPAEMLSSGHITQEEYEGQVRAENIAELRVTVKLSSEKS